MTRNIVTVVIIRSLSLSSGKTKESPWVLPCQEYQNKTQTLDVIVVLNSTHSIHFILKAWVSDSKQPQKAANMWCDNDGTSFDISAFYPELSQLAKIRHLFSPCVDILQHPVCAADKASLCSLGVAQEGSPREAGESELHKVQGQIHEKTVKSSSFELGRESLSVGASPSLGSWPCHRARVAATWTGCSKLWSGLCLGKDENTQALTDTDICKHNAQLPHGKKELSQPEPCSPNLTFRGKVLKSLVGR